MRAPCIALSLVACTSPPPPPAHTIESAPSNSTVAEAHWPDAGASAPVDRTNVIRTLTAIHAAVEVWRVSHADECPTLERLKDEGELGAAASTKDEWGNPFRVLCDENDTIIVSIGPDRREGTPDDIVYPARKDAR